MKMRDEQHTQCRDFMQSEGGMHIIGTEGGVWRVTICRLFMTPMIDYIIVFCVNVDSLGP